MIPNDDQQQIRDMARQFAEERLKPFAAEWDREHRFPKEAIGEMADLGFFGMLVPEQWGGCDTGYLAYAMALEEIAAGDGACSTIMSVHNSVGCVPILNYGNDDQKERFLKPLASGAMLGAFALTEPQAGSDASGLKTRARLDGAFRTVTAVTRHATVLGATLPRRVTSGEVVTIGIGDVGSSRESPPPAWSTSLPGCACSVASAARTR